MADVKVVKSIYTGADVTSLGEVAAADNARLPGSFQVDGTATIGSLAGLLKAAAGVISATALGAANTKLFMNAAGDAPEWAVGISVGNTTYDVSTATGDVAYTGIGFKPSYILLMISVVNTSGMSIGAGNVASSFCIYDKPGGITWGPNSTLLVVFVSGSDYITGIIKSMDVDGFTLTYTKVNSPTGTATLIWMAFR